MSYEYRLCNEQSCDFNTMRHTGWSNSNRQCLQQFFSKQTVDLISRKVTELTMGVDPHNRKIVVPPVRICEVMDGVYQGYRPSTGDIYSRYIITNDQQQNMVQSLIDQTIEIIVSNIRNTLGIEQANQKLSAWVQVYGDFNTQGLRQHPPIKVQNKRPVPMQFNMNY